ncbi:hypothetical protein FMUND_12880 [Fusarium mundagurra]|uniref:Uncharacterized protein n=1 Tax=Fusarium mundagurra TaxID=1567541 RepID=A0A8H6D540_9HYPO|nr:hypothetical protein FMUND_12880 [Fusarium mundagurra]
MTNEERDISRLARLDTYGGQYSKNSTLNAERSRLEAEIAYLSYLLGRLRTHPHPTERPVPCPQIWGWALAIVTPAAVSGLPNAPATRCAPFQWYRNAFMTEMEVMDHVPFIVKMALRWFEKVEGKAKKAVAGRSPRIRPGSFTTITVADTVDGMSGGAP